jgi:hypothetical protein
VIPKLDGVIIVPQIGCIGIGTDITPLTNYGISKEAVVGFVGISENDRIAYLPTDL